MEQPTRQEMPTVNTNIDHLRQWIGKSETREDRITLTPIAALAATLDRDDPLPRDGDPLPPLWHWLYFLPLHRQSELGPDGHPKRGGFIPPVPLPRRMFAGGRQQFHRPLRVGEKISRVSRIADVTHKIGRNGPLVFVLVRHEISNQDGLALVEEHDIVYRDHPRPGERRAGLAKRADRCLVDARDYSPTPRCFSAIRRLPSILIAFTTIGDIAPTSKVIPGLVVHGPLIATLLADLLRRNLPDVSVTNFSFRAVKPIFDTHPFSCQRPLGRRWQECPIVGQRLRRLAVHGRNRHARMNHPPAVIAVSGKNLFAERARPISGNPLRRARTLRAISRRNISADIDEQRAYPEEFVDALTKAGWLAALIPEEYGGGGLSLTEASVIMEEINRSGGNAGACHGQMYNMGTLLRHGSEEQKREYLPKIANGELRLQSMAVTEPTAGTDTTKIKTTAVRKGDRYVVNGQKVWISRVQHSDLMILLARTTPLAEVKKKSEGMSIFLVDLREAIGKGLTVRPIPNMVNHETNELFFDNLEIPAENLIGEEGKGFKYILDGLNAERTLIAAECIGDGYWFIDKVTKYAKERIVFGRPIGQNQGVQFPIAKAYIEYRSRQSDALQGLRAVRRAPALRRRSQHGAAAGGGSFVGSGQRLPAIPRRLRFRVRIRCGAQIPRNAAVSGCADFDESDSFLRWRARARTCRDRSDGELLRPLDGITVVALEHAISGAVLHAPTRRSRRARDQDRAARRG